MTTTELIFSAVVSLICIVPIFILGIVQYRSESPVGFWSGKKPPAKEEITDVRAYNRKHGLMWILYAAGFLLCFVGGLFFGGDIAAVLSMVEGMGGIFVMIAYHNKLNRIYYKGNQHGRK